MLRNCRDWNERRHHLARIGAKPAARCHAAAAMDEVGSTPRALMLTSTGRDALSSADFGLDASDLTFCAVCSRQLSCSVGVTTWEQTPSYDSSPVSRL